MKNIVTIPKELVIKTWAYTALEQKFLFYILSFINPLTIKEEINGNAWKIIKLEKKIIAEILWVSKKHVYSYIISFLEKLEEKKPLKISTFEWNKETKTTLWRIIASTNINHWASDFEVIITSHMLQYFESDFLKKNWYTTIKIREILPLKSKYSIALLNLINSDKFKEKFWKQVLFTPEEINEICNTSMDYSNLKRTVILKSIEDINSNLSLNLSFKEIFKWKRVEKIHFFFRKKAWIVEIEKIETENNDIEKILNEDHYKIYLKLVNEWISEKKSFDIIKNQNILKSDILKNIEYVNELDKNLYPFRNWKTNFLIASIEKNYQASSLKKKNDFKKIQKEIEEKEKQEEENKKRDLMDNKKKFIDWWDSLSKHKKEELIEKYKTWSIYQDKDSFIKSRISSDFIKWKIK